MPPVRVKDRAQQSNKYFNVEVWVDILNIMDEPGRQSSGSGDVYKGEVFTIVEVSGEWGRIKGTEGWILLRHTAKL